MNITELIERMRVFEADHEPDGWPAIRMREVSALCDSLLEQQRVIEKMREALIDEYNYQCAHCHEPNHNLSEALARQPDLSALREHDAEVVAQCYYVVRGAPLSVDGVALTALQVLSIYDQLTLPLRTMVERIRKGVTE